MITTIQCCTAQSSFNHCMPQIFLPLTSVHRTSSRHSFVQCPTHRKIAGTFDPRVAQNVDRQSLDVRENGQDLGPHAGSPLCRPWDFSSNTAVADHIMALKETTTFLGHALQTQTTPQTWTTHVLSRNGPLLIVIKCRGPLPLPENPKLGLGAAFHQARNTFSHNMPFRWIRLVFV